MLTRKTFDLSKIPFMLKLSIRHNFSRWIVRHHHRTMLTINHRFSIENSCVVEEIPRDDEVGTRQLDEGTHTRE